MSKCFFCSSYCDGKKTVPLTGMFLEMTIDRSHPKPVCKECFDLWIRNEDKLLLAKIKEDLLGKPNKSKENI